ncbi:uncharacterized protein DSM5745_00339 [Aspergillus mulundensis]|uniref:Condensation domain-containing protein n=1 Tax=Aspergillus mulundensis TaxID=1810919 RepID=A0A3D8T379_9EURO|nr:Uncharacterized protein DSM5745_00339 [Aspergillus mulundensis]RDW93017.1 Uncharacterized protein DSM5745_00339 [Aspergillus mulundensis]
MTTTIAEPYNITRPHSVSEWKLSGTCLVRPLRGAELLVRSSEHYCDGNFNLTTKATISSTLTDAQLLRRHQAAWYRTRLVHPVIGVHFPTLEQASYALHQTASEAKQWTQQTCLVETKTTVNDVYLARSRAKMGAISMTLVLDPARGPRGCVLNISHTLMNADFFVIVQEYIAQLGNTENERGVEGIFNPTLETVQSISPRLPQSLSNAYTRLTPSPTPQDLQDAMHAYERAQARWTRPSIGIPLHPNHARRTRHIQNKTIAFEPSESRAAFSFLKESGLSLTAAFFASMVAAIATRYPATPEEQIDGAHLCFPVHGRRRLDTDATEDGAGPVRMPIIPCSAWVSSHEADLTPTSQKGLMRLAAQISRAMNDEVSSPHVIAVFEQLGPEMARAIADASTAPPEPPAAGCSAARGRPTLTSQGQFSNARDRLAQTQTKADGENGEGGTAMSDFNSGGRTTDPSVCFALNSFRDELRFNLLFDERFFGYTETMMLGFEVAGLFRRLVGIHGDGDGDVSLGSVRARL